MIKQKSLIGTKLDCTFRTVEESQINRLINIFKEPTSTWQSLSQEANNSHLHYPTFLIGNLINLPKLYKTLGLNINNVLLSRESVISHKPVNVGDRLNLHTYLRDAYEQQASSNPIGFIILETIGLQNEDLVFYSERVLAVRGGFHRGRI